jgi:GTP-binding protein
MIVDDAPGTTRDAVQHSITYNGKPWVLIDTAGMRRRRSIDLIAEELSVLHAVKAMSLADVVLMLIDVTEEIADQDLRIANLAIKRGRGLVVGLNKWDIAGDKPELEFAKPFSDTGTMHYIPVERLSGKESWNLDKVFTLVERVAVNRKRHISTGVLNRFIEKVVSDHQPPAFRHKPVTIKYATQVDDSPPIFALFTNHPEGFQDTYRRYIENRFREDFDFLGVPIRLVFKRKGKERKKR